MNRRVTASAGAEASSREALRGPDGRAGTLKMFSGSLKVVSESRVELEDVTDRVIELVRASGIEDGMLTVTSLHTTSALFVNEFQAALLDDIAFFLERLVSSEGGYLHNCEDCSDCERKNADAHLRALVLGHQVTMPVRKGDLVLGQWQSILFAELDGPKERTLEAQILGI